MKKYSSVMMLAVQNSIYKIIGLLMITASVQLGIFYWFAGRKTDWESFFREMPFVNTFIPDWWTVLAGISFVALCMLLVYPECEYGGSRIQYSIQRLQVTEKAVFYLWTLYHVIVLLIFWFVQILLAYASCAICLNQPGAEVAANAHSVFMIFSRDSFLHSLMPLYEVSRYIRNGFLILGMAFSMSAFSWKQRRGKRSFSVIALLAVVLIFFRQNVGSWVMDIILSVAAVICIGAALYVLWIEETFMD